MLALNNMKICGFTFRVKKLGTNIFGVEGGVVGVEGGVVGNEVVETGDGGVDMVDMDILYMLSRF